MHGVVEAHNILAQIRATSADHMCGAEPPQLKIWQLLKLANQNVIEVTQMVAEPIKMVAVIFCTRGLQNGDRLVCPGLYN